MMYLSSTLHALIKDGNLRCKDGQRDIERKFCVVDHHAQTDIANSSMRKAKKEGEKKENVCVFVSLSPSPPPSFLSKSKSKTYTSSS